MLEIGPGFGPATELLAGRVPRLTALEIDTGLAHSLRERLGDRAEIVEGDGATMPFTDARFDAAVCFTMLHHVPSAEAQDRLFTEVHRVLRPGGVFAGTDSLGKGVGFALLHIGDTKNLIDPGRHAGPAVGRGLRAGVRYCGRATAIASARSPCSAAGCGRARSAAASAATETIVRAP